MNWISRLPRPTAKTLFLTSTGVGLSYFAYSYYKRKNNSDESERQLIRLTLPDVIIEMDDIDTDGKIENFDSSCESINVEMELGNKSWVTPTASNEKLVCRTVSCEEEGDVEDQSPRKNSKEPVESDSLNDGFDEQKPNRKILILGLENSGKSALLSQLSKEGKDCTEYEQTKGFNVVCISFQSLDLNIWEIGGNFEYRSYWKNFSTATDLILFAVDSSNPESFPIAKQYFNDIITEVNEQSDFHIIATKADKENSASTEQIQQALGLDGMKIDVLKVAVKTGGAKENIGLEAVQKCCLYELED